MRSATYFAVWVTGSAYWAFMTSWYGAMREARFPVLKNAVLYWKNCGQCLRMMRAGIESALV